MLNISKTLWWIFSIWSLTIYTLTNIPFDFIAIGYYLKICLTIFLNIHLNMHVGVMYVLHKGPGSQLRQTRSIDHISETVHCTVKQTLWYIHWTIANQEVGSYLGKCAIEWNGPILGPSALHDQPAYDQYGSSWMNQNKTSILSLSDKIAKLPYKLRLQMVPNNHIKSDCSAKTLAKIAKWRRGSQI